MEDNKETVEQQEKTFTQEQLNAIVGKRLSEQKQQQDAELVKKTEELNKREMVLKAKEMLSEKKLPKELAEVLKYDNEEELKKALDILENVRGFKKEDMEDQAKSEYKVLEDNRLPKSNYPEKDISLAKAFGIKRKE